MPYPAETKKIAVKYSTFLVEISQQYVKLV